MGWDGIRNKLGWEEIVRESEASLLCNTYIQLIYQLMQDRNILFYHYTVHFNTIKILFL